MIYLHKLLALAVSPLVLVMLLLTWGAIKRSRRTIVLAIALLYVASMPLASSTLFRWVEQHQVRLSPETLEGVDAIVVLSGMLRTVPAASGVVSEWGEASDRLFGGVDLYLAGKAPRLVLTRGLLPWQGASQPEGEVLQRLAVRLGVPQSAITVSGLAQNTEQEARAVRTVLDAPSPRIALVTSAFHMHRARRSFEHVGFSVTPYPVDFRVTADDTTPMDFLPSASALEQTDTALRELLGRAYYAIKNAL